MTRGATTPEVRAALLALPLWRDEDAAAFFGLTRDSLRRWVLEGGGPDGPDPCLARQVRIPGGGRYWLPGDLVRVVTEAARVTMSARAAGHRGGAGAPAARRGRAAR